MKRLSILLCMASALAPSAASAQANPFQPPSSGGMSKAQVEQIVKQQMRNNPSGPSNGAPAGPSAAPGTSGVPSGAPVAGTPSVPPGTPSQAAGPGAGIPAGSPVAGGAAVTAIVAAEDPVAALMSDGGSFVGCVRQIPIFRDKMGRRIYFTGKELKASEASRRYARC